MKRYTEEQREFLFAYIPGHTSREIAAEFARRFGVEMKPSCVQSFKKNNRTKSGTKAGPPKGAGTSLFPEEVVEFICRNRAGKPLVQFTEEVNRAFGSGYTVSQMRARCKAMRVKSGLTGRFEKGHRPTNAGKKGQCAQGCEKTWFRKGSQPHNQVPVGTEVMATIGYIKVKVAEPNVWRFKHVLEWERHHGAVPAGMVVSFKDGNHNNCDVANLMLLSRAENAIMNNCGLRSGVPELADTEVAIAKVMHAISRAQNRPAT